MRPMTLSVGLAVGLGCLALGCFRYGSAGSANGLVDKTGGGSGNPMFATSPADVLAIVTLREDAANPACRSPLMFLQEANARLQALDLGVGACVPTLISPDDVTGATLHYRCPVRQAGPLCTEYFEAYVWPVLAKERAYQPYDAVFRFNGISRGYVRCRHAPERPFTDEATREVPGSQVHTGGERLFTGLARECDASPIVPREPAVPASPPPTDETNDTDPAVGG